MRIAGCLLVMAMVFVFPQTTANASREALQIFAHDIVPSLYPYMILTKTLAVSLQGKSRSSAWLAVILGMLGGAPSGASMLISLADNHALRRRTLYTICTLIGTISPVFLLHTAGIWLGQSQIVHHLIVSHFAGAALSAILVYVFLRKDVSFVYFRYSEPENTGSSPILTCVSSVLGIGGCLVFFSVVSALIRVGIPDTNALFTAVLHSVFEIAGGLKALSMHADQGTRLVGVLCAACCGFSGISMLSQNHMFLKSFGVTMSELIILGMLRASCSGLIMGILSIG